jgi:hypothetical protein
LPTAASAAAAPNESIAIKGYDVVAYSAEGKPTIGQVGFRSQSEMISMMADPRYKTDPSFRQDVVRRMAVTKFAD